MNNDKNKTERARFKRCLAARLGAVAVTLVAVFALASLGTPARQASAHSDFDRSQPAEDSVVPESPDRIDMWFSQEMARAGGLPTVTVVNEAGDVIADGPVLDDEDRKHISIELPPALPERKYTVIWHNVSDEDGEEAQGAFHFYVGQGLQEGSSETPLATERSIATPAPVVQDSDQDDDGSGAPWWLLAVVAITGVSLGVAGSSAVWTSRLGNRLERQSGVDDR